jgi:sigma-B regulation protein RsbU (phosphoserine phosphatase)
LNSTIVVIDDEADVLELLSFNLNRQGYTVETFDDPELALNFIKNNKTDLILSDWMMPEISGMELLATIKSSSITSSIPFVMMTCKDNEADVVEALQAGADDYIKKPFSLKELVLRLNKIFKWDNQSKFLQNENLENKLQKKHYDDIIQSIAYAKKLQLAILPSKADFLTKFPHSFVFFQPKEMVSGDFFWYNQKGDSLILAVADCTGHGVPASLMTILGNAMLQRIVVEEKERNPGKILEHLDVAIINALKQTNGAEEPKDGMDVSLVEFNLATRRGIFAGAFGKLFLAKNSDVIEISGNRYPIGGLQLEKNRKYQTHFFELEYKQQIFLTTDGFYDQFGGSKGKKFKKTPFKNLLEVLSTIPNYMQETELHRIFTEWKGINEQTDDVLVLGFNI